MPCPYKRDNLFVGVFQRATPFDAVILQLAAVPNFDISAIISSSKPTPIGAKRKKIARFSKLLANLATLNYLQKV
ncbi:hypothetical protein [Calothrix sp. NIES-2100]|uniref:hypothetical protein n=1 Tax=Calothrix sp. NIES-2100 TaxID=1954172 RepID=UPI000BBCE2A5